MPPTHLLLYSITEQADSCHDRFGAYFWFASIINDSGLVTTSGPTTTALHIILAHNYISSRPHIEVIYTHFPGNNKAFKTLKNINKYSNVTFISLARVSACQKAYQLVGHQWRCSVVKTDDVALSGTTPVHYIRTLRHREREVVLVTCIQRAREGESRDTIGHVTEYRRQVVLCVVGRLARGDCVSAEYETCFMTKNTLTCAIKHMCGTSACMIKHSCGKAACVIKNMQCTAACVIKHMLCTAECVIKHT